MTRWVLASLALLLAAPAAAAAREPVISYVDENGVFRLFDEQTEAEVEPPPPVPVANALQFRYGISLDGRYIAYTDGDKKIHLLDRATNTELPLPGIDVYAGNPQGPQNLTVSNTGLIAFDNNNNGPAVVYDSASRTFIQTGFADNNGHRQTRLSGDGRFLATTCTTQCIVEPVNGVEAYVQDLTNKTDTAFPFEGTRDEEHTCINGDGSILGFDKDRGGMNTKNDIFLFDRTGAIPQPIDVSMANGADTDDVRCVLDSAGEFVGLFNNDTAAFSAFDIALQKFIMLPSDKEFNEFSLFSEPYSPPPTGGGPTTQPRPPPDVTSPVAQRFRMTHRRFRPRRGATRFRFRLSEAADVRIVVRRRSRQGRRMGALRRDDLPAGPNAISFSGKFRGRALRPGRYVAVLTATDAAGNVSVARSIRFRVLRAGGDRRH